MLGNDETKYNKDIGELNIFAENNDINKCFRTSALTGYNVEESLDFLIKEIITIQGDNDDNINRERKDSLFLKKDMHQNGIRTQEKNKCC